MVLQVALFACGYAVDKKSGVHSQIVHPFLVAAAYFVVKNYSYDYGACLPNGKPYIVELPVLQMLLVSIPMTCGCIGATMFIDKNILARIEITEKFEKAMKTDMLTQVYNRNVLNDMYDESKDQLKDRNVSLILMDIDYFKKINDSLGHNVGDEFLVDLVRIIRECTRSSDTIIRWGGEEFLIILKGVTDGRRAQYVAEKIRIHVESSVVRNLHYTISLGVSVYQSDRSYTKNIGIVDEALYESKNNGRNQTTLA